MRIWEQKATGEILVAFMIGKCYNGGEKQKMDKEIIRSFICQGKYMVVVKLENGVHVMEYDEWKFVYGKLHPERWKKENAGKKESRIA